MFVACADSGGTGDDEGDDQGGAVCGDATCAASEVGHCTADCGAGGNNNATNCGNGMCETTGGENSSSCPLDCTTGGSGSGSGSGSGNQNGACPADPLTECLTCILDGTGCPPGLDQDGCTQCIFGGLGSGGGSGGFSFCENMAPDGVCNAGAGEDATTCPDDCP